MAFAIAATHIAIIVACDRIIDLLGNPCFSPRCLKAMTGSAGGAHRRLKPCDFANLHAPALTEVVSVPACGVRLESRKELSRCGQALDVLSEAKVDHVLMDDNQAMATLGPQGRIVSCSVLRHAKEVQIPSSDLQTSLAFI